MPYESPVLPTAIGNVDEWSTKWNAGRMLIEQNLDVAPVEDKKRFNVWDKLDALCETLKRMRGGEWTWVRNNRCKYISVRIDMRSGDCLYFDSTGNRINPSDLKFQHRSQ